MIEFKNIKKVYGKTTVLDIPHLVINEGDLIGLVGNNGAGKTTSFSIMLDLIHPFEGVVTSKDNDVSKDENWKTYTSSFLDESYLIDFLTPDEYFSFVGSLYNWNQADIDAFLTPYEEFLNDEIIGKKKYIRDLSKGNQKKVGLIAAFMGEPEVIILDEPFSNLDPTSQNRLKKIIAEIAKNKTVVISSHDLNHVIDVCKRILVMEKGLIIKDLEISDEAINEVQDYFEV